MNDEHNLTIDATLAERFTMCAANRWAWTVLALWLAASELSAQEKKPDFKPCIDMAKEHLRMLALFKEDLKKLAQEVEELERRTQLPKAQAP